MLAHSVYVHHIRTQQQAKVLATYVSQMEQGCKAFVDTHINGKEGSPVAIYEPIRAFLIEMPLRLILGLGDTAPEIVSNYDYDHQYLIRVLL
jgi:hypothetical protein